MIGSLAPSGNLAAKVIRAPKAPLAWRIKNATRRNNITGMVNYHAAIAFSRVTGIPCMLGRLDAKLIKSNGQVIDYGTLGYRSITTAFVNFVCAQLATETAVFGDFKYHDSGVGVTAENITDTDIETTDGEARATGDQTPSTNTYISVGTISYTTTKAITEHGLFNASTGVTLMDRTVFTVINVANGDSIAFTYTLTLTAGS